jgi:hypothetical protein
MKIWRSKQNPRSLLSSFIYSYCTDFSPYRFITINPIIIIIAVFCFAFVKKFLLKYARIILSTLYLLAITSNFRIAAMFVVID